VHKFGHFSLKFDYSLFRLQKTRKTEKTLVMPRKAAKAVPPRAVSDRTRTVSQKVQSNAAITANYWNKHAKRPIIIENSSDNDSSDKDIEEPIRKQKPPPEPRLVSFLINATTFLGKECILHVSKFVNLHQCGASIYFRDSQAKLSENCKWARY